MSLIGSRTLAPSSALTSHLTELTGRPYKDFAHRQFSLKALAAGLIAQGRQGVRSVGLSRSFGNLSRGRDVGLQRMQSSINVKSTIRRKKAGAERRSIHVAASLSGLLYTTDSSTFRFTVSRKMSGRA